MLADTAQAISLHRRDGGVQGGHQVHGLTVLSRPAAFGRLGLTPLFWSHAHPYCEVNLDMGARRNPLLSRCLAPHIGG